MRKNNLMPVQRVEVVDGKQSQRLKVDPNGPTPKVVHFIWLQGEDHMKSTAPSYWRNVEFTRAIMGLDWEVRLWDETSLKPLMATIDKALWPRYCSLDRLEMKADLARFCVLKTYGGIYLDADFIVARNFASLRCLADEPYLAMRRCRFGGVVHSLLNGTLSTHPESLQTYILVSPPGHKVWDFLVDHILTFRRQHLFEPDALYYARFTCLNALGHAVNRYLREEPHGTPIIYITHLTDYYGKHVGKGEWAGLLTSYGASRHELMQELN